MNGDVVVGLAAMAGAALILVLLTVYWFDQWAQDRLDASIEEALDLANSCACGDPNEVTVAHSAKRCSVRGTSKGL